MLLHRKNETKTILSYICLLNVCNNNYSHLPYSNTNFIKKTRWVNSAKIEVAIIIRIISNFALLVMQIIIVAPSTLANFGWQILFGNIQIFLISFMPPFLNTYLKIVIKIKKR